MIDSALFTEIFDYFFCDDAPSDCAADRIRFGLSKKLDSLFDRAIFSRYKRASTPVEREMYRKEYISRRGFHSDFVSESEVHFDE